MFGKNMKVNEPNHRRLNGNFGYSDNLKMIMSDKDKTII